MTVSAVYQKLQKIDPVTSAALVRYAPAEAAATIRDLHGEPQALLDGSHVKVLDGSHLPSSQRRFKEPRGLEAVTELLAALLAVSRVVEQEQEGVDAQNL